MANDFVKLNVGGISYTTSRSTLTRYADSMLAAMFNGSIPSTKDDDGCFLIDRDGQIFRHILNFLRCGTLLLPKSFEEYDLLLYEADFYQITALVKAIQDYSKARTETEPENSYPFYSLDIWYSGRIRTDQVVGTVDSLLQLPSSVLDDATRALLKLKKLSDNSISAVCITHGDRVSNFHWNPISLLNDAGWFTDESHISFISTGHDTEDTTLIRVLKPRSTLL